VRDRVVDARVSPGIESGTRVTAAPRRRRIALLLALTLASPAGCARLFTRPTRGATGDAAAIIAAGAAREDAISGLRLTLSVRATAGPPAARLASPAYLAIDDPEHLRLQVLSPFGVTVLNLTTSGDTFTLALPMRGETRSGRIDLAALAAGATPEDERMIVALALLFRPKMDRARCRAAGATAVSCTVGPDLTATIAVDQALRTVREDFAGPAGLIFSAVLEDYTSTTRDALPGRITISDGQGGAALVIRVVKVARGAQKT
jgi:hypothetical protein